MNLAFDSKALDAAINAGLQTSVFEQLAHYGICFDGVPVENLKFWKPGLPTHDMKLACDVQSELVTVNNAGIPSYLANIFDPKVIQILVTAMMGAEIAGEIKKGDWTMATVTFQTAEQTGEVSSYGDYSNAGQSNVNTNYPARQNYLYQCFLQYGDLELARAGLAGLDWASQQQQANALTLNKYQNETYFFGVANLQNYGLLNDPSLPASITPTFSWLTSSSATANTIYQDIVRLFIQLQQQSNGLIKEDAPLILSMSPTQALALKYITQYNTNSVEVLIKQNFPNLVIKTAVQYNTAAGQLVQLICTELEGQRTLNAAYSDKMRAHSMVRDSSSIKQKRSQGSWGTIIFRPFLISSMIG